MNYKLSLHFNLEGIWHMITLMYVHKNVDMTKSMMQTSFKEV